MPERERLRRGKLLKLLATANLPLSALLLPSTFVPHLDMISFAALLIQIALISAVYGLFVSIKWKPEQAFI